MSVSTKDFTKRSWLRHYPTSVLPTPHYPEIPLHEILADQAKSMPDVMSLHFFGRKMSDASLFDETRPAAAGLVHPGLTKGEVY